MLFEIYYVFRLHIMSGRQMENQGSEATLLKNMQAAVPILEQNNIVGLLEPINGYSVPQYFLNNYETGELLEKGFECVYI